MTDPQGNQLLSIEEASDMLRVSTRTVRRWIKDGKLDRVTVQGKFGPEIRLKREQVLTLSKGDDKRSVSGRQAGMDKPVDSVQGSVIRLEDFLDRLEDVQREKETAVARMAYLQGKLDAQESEVKMLKSASEERQLESERLKTQLTEAESQKRALEDQLKRQRVDLQGVEQQHAVALQEAFQVLPAVLGGGEGASQAQACKQQCFNTTQSPSLHSPRPLRSQTRRAIFSLTF